MQTVRREEALGLKERRNLGPQLGCVRHHSQRTMERDDASMLRPGLPGIPELRRPRDNSRTPTHQPGGVRELCEGSPKCLARIRGRSNGQQRELRPRQPTIRHSERKHQQHPEKRPSVLSGAQTHRCGLRRRDGLCVSQECRPPTHARRANGGTNSRTRQRQSSRWPPLGTETKNKHRGPTDNHKRD